MRLRELASELGVKPKQLRSKASALGLAAVNDNDTLTHKEEELLRDHWQLSTRELRALKQGLQEEVQLSPDKARKTLRSPRGLRQFAARGRDGQRPSDNGAGGRLATSRRRFPCRIR
jgi:hypothetical protein